MAAFLPDKLSQIVEDFQWAEGREKIELLIQYAEEMSPLPEHIEKRHDEMQQVHECMTPVFVLSEMQNGGMHFYFDVPKESPTVRGFAAILGKGLDGATPEQILAIPNDFFQTMGLESVLTHQRMNGIAAILAYIKRLAAGEMA